MAWMRHGVSRWLVSYRPLAHSDQARRPSTRGTRLTRVRDGRRDLSNHASKSAELATAARREQKAWVTGLSKKRKATMTAVVGSAAEDTTPSEREAPQRFAWWHPRSADLGRRADEELRPPPTL